MVAIFAALMVALMVAGFAYAHWEETITISGTVTTGTFDLRPTCDIEILSPTDKDVATVDCQIDGDTVSYTIENAFPCLTVKAKFDLHNEGVVPAGLYKWTATYDNTMITIFDAENIGGSIISPAMTEDEVEQALEDSKKGEGRLGACLVKNKAINEKDLLPFLSKQYGVKAIDLDSITPEQNIIDLIPSEIALKYQVIPIKKSGRVLTVAIADPFAVIALDALRFRTGYDIDPVVAPESMILRHIDKYYQAAATYAKIMDDIELDEEVSVIDETEEEDTMDAAAEEAPVIRLVNSMLVDAVKKGVSDIHFECFEKSLRLRFRIDGTLIEQPPPPFSLKNAIISRMKIISNLDISERRVPQDGRTSIRLKGRKIDFRVSTMPTIFGEKVVMRILDKGNLTLDLTSFGFEKRALENFMTAIHKPYGIVLVTGPTGSGKTTTLYSALSQINGVDVNISTAEDPVEYNLYGINQVLVREEVGMTFAAALKAFLRQDPDIIMVGEIRDLDTGAIAVKAALTGHLVLSTMHTNSAPGTVTRMVDMGIDPFNVANAVVLIQAQRLLKRICKECKHEEKIPPQAFKSISLNPQKMVGKKFYTGSGCDKCNGSGYKGRCGIYEVMPFSDAIRRIILDGGTEPDIKKQAIKEGMMTLRMDAIIKWMKGITDLKQVIEKTA